MSCVSCGHTARQLSSILDLLVILLRKLSAMAATETDSVIHLKANHLTQSSKVMAQITD